MASAFLAVLPLAYCRLLKHADIFGAGYDAHGVGFPKRKSVERSTWPRTAWSAMAIPHAFGFAWNFYLNSSTKTFAFACCHCDTSFVLVAKAMSGWKERQRKTECAKRRSGPSP